MGFWNRQFRKQDSPPSSSANNPTTGRDDLGHDAPGLPSGKSGEDAIALLEGKAFEEGAGVEPLLTLAQAYLDIHDTEQAVDILNIAKERFPNDGRAFRGLGEIALAAKQWSSAEDDLKQALVLDPNDEISLLRLAEVLHKTQRISEEKDLLRAHNSAEQKSPKLLYQCALASFGMGDYPETLSFLDKIVEMTPDAEDEVINLRAATLLYSGNHAEAHRVLERGLYLSPESPRLRYIRGLLHLMHDELSQGWDGYQYRLTQDPVVIRALHIPRWQGEPLIGKTIVVTQEQGLGDQIMFASCIPDLVNTGASRIIMEVNNRLGSLFTRSFPEIEVISSEQEQDFSWLPQETQLDYYIQLGDLPRFFRSQLSSFPETPTPYLKALNQKSSQALKSNSRLRVGLSWKGGLPLTRSFIRTLQISDLAPLLAIPGIDWIGLQFGASLDELQSLRDLVPEATLALDESVGKDIDELASLIETLDLVITACNTNVHIAGALGKEVWVMTPLQPEWRYGLKSTMPWYPSATLFRQQSAGDWDSVTDLIAGALRKRLLSFSS